MLSASNSLCTFAEVTAIRTPEAILKTIRAGNLMHRLVQEMLPQDAGHEIPPPFRIACIQGSALPSKQRFVRNIMGISREKGLKKLSVEHALPIYGWALTANIAFRELVIVHAPIELPRVKQPHKNRSYIISILVTEGTLGLGAFRCEGARSFASDVSFLFGLP